MAEVEVIPPPSLTTKHQQPKPPKQPRKKTMEPISSALPLPVEESEPKKADVETAKKTKKHEHHHHHHCKDEEESGTDHHHHHSSRNDR